MSLVKAKRTKASATEQKGRSKGKFKQEFIKMRIKWFSLVRIAGLLHRSTLSFLQECFLEALLGWTFSTHFLDFAIPHSD